MVLGRAEDTINIVSADIAHCWAVFGTGKLQWNRQGGVKPRPCDHIIWWVPTAFLLVPDGFDRDLQHLRG